MNTNILYKSTRGSKKKATAAQAILEGLAEDGGLYVPEYIPKLPMELKEMGEMSYQEVAFQILSFFFSDFTEQEIRDCVNQAYNESFDVEEIVPIVKIGNQYYLELFHGATLAFKDMALSILPHLMTTAAKKQGLEKKILILTATSGDTGKAALSGFAEVEGTKIIVFYPKNGVSRVQELQMRTQKGSNVDVVALHGNFDDAQSGVKSLFESEEMKRSLETKGYQFSSANSINIGRLIPQVVYYVFACAKLWKEGELTEGEKIDVVVPTGNFGNILAAYYGKKMGLPIGNLICASNENKVLFDFFHTGKYDKNRDFLLTSSPSMDILISSNLERLLYHASEENTKEVSAYMKCLKEAGEYQITETLKENLEEFIPGFATEEEVREEIGKVFQETGYVMDTHTGVASAVSRKFKEKKKVLVVSTASPYKFVKSVVEAIEGERGEEEFSLLKRLGELSQVEIPRAVQEILDAEVVHHLECSPDGMQELVEMLLEKEGKKDVR